MIGIRATRCIPWTNRTNLFISDDKTKGVLADFPGIELEFSSFLTTHIGAFVNGKLNSVTYDFMRVAVSWIWFGFELCIGLENSLNHLEINCIVIIAVGEDRQGIGPISKPSRTVRIDPPENLIQ